MPRIKSITTEQLITLADEYYLENAGATIKIPAFGAYIRSKGYNVQDHTLRRDKEFVAYIDATNDKTNTMRQSELVTYKTLDVEAFLQHNRSKDQLKSALVERDRYYARIAASAADAIKAKNQYQEEVNKLSERVSELEEALNTAKEKIKKERDFQKDEVIRKLRKIINSYIYPDAANHLLEKEGVLEVMGEIIPSEIMDAKTVHANTKIDISKLDSSVTEQENKSSFSVVNKLSSGFDQ